MRRRSPLIKQVQGVAVYLNPGKETTPLALRVGVDRIRAIHETIVIVSVETTTVPHVPQEERVVFDHLGDEQDDFSHITLRFGFQDSPDVPRTLMRARSAPGGLPVDFNPYHATYFLSSITIVPDRSPGMAFWRKLLFTAMARNAASPTEYFRLPAERVVTMGSQIVF
jgi:KUP system potassium uptake protein